MATESVALAPLSGTIVRRLVHLKAFAIRIALLNTLMYAALACGDDYLNVSVTGYIYSGQFNAWHWISIGLIPVVFLTTFAAVQLGRFKGARTYGVVAFVLMCLCSYLGCWAVFSNGNFPTITQTAPYLWYFLPAVMAYIINASRLSHPAMEDPAIGRDLKIEYVKEQIQQWRLLAFSSLGLFGLIVAVIEYVTGALKGVVDQEHTDIFKSIIFSQWVIAIMYIFLGPVLQCFLKYRQATRMLLQHKGLR